MKKERKIIKHNGLELISKEANGCFGCYFDYHSNEDEEFCFDDINNNCSVEKIIWEKLEKGPKLDLKLKQKIS